MKIISFNSYKGGSCRTTTCANTIPFLAKALHADAKHPIILVDLDLDSMGLTSIVDKLTKRDTERTYSSRDLCVDTSKNAQEHARSIEAVGQGDFRYFDLYEKVGRQFGLEEEGTILFLGANPKTGTIGDSDRDRLFANDSPMTKLVNSLLDLEDDDADDRPTAIVFDCASGAQMTTLAVLRKIDTAVMCMRPTVQARIGTSMYLKGPLPREFRNSINSKQHRVILLPTAVSEIKEPFDKTNRIEVDSYLTLKNLRQKAFDEIEAHIIRQIIGNVRINYQLQIDMAENKEEDGVIGIPEIDRFKWEEGLLFEVLGGQEMTCQEKKLNQQYEKLANLIARD